MRTIEYERPYLYPAQEDAIFTDDRFAWIEASTKSGKTHGCIVWLTEQALLYGGEGKNYWWVAPRYNQAKIAFRRLKLALPSGSFSENLTDLAITLMNGATIWFKSGDDPDALYGEDVYAAVIDEASRVKADVWPAIVSTLTATNGKVRIIGNVKGKRNWFYRGARQADRGLKGHHYARLTAYDAIRGGVFGKDVLDQAKETMPESFFNELYMAIPGEDGDAFFHTDRIEVVEDYPRHARLARGWDFAASKKKSEDRDWTVGVLLAHTPEITYVVDVYRERIGAEQALPAVEAKSLEDGDHVSIIIEQEPGSSGKIMVDLIKQHLRNTPGTGRVHGSPTSGDKDSRAFGFATRVNGRKVALVKGEWNDEFLAELDDFPPDGGHDDQVDAASHAFNWLAGHGRSRIRFSDEIDEEEAA